MTPVSSPTTENETPSSPFFSLLQQIPLQCHEKEQFLQSELLGVQVYPERFFLVLRLKMASPGNADCYANVSRYLKESLPGVSRVVSGRPLRRASVFLPPITWLPTRKTCSFA